MTESTFRPNWASPVGETIAQLMSAGELDDSKLAAHLGTTINETRSVLSGVTPLSRKFAEKISEILGGSPAFWLKRDSSFRENAEKIPKRYRYEQEWFRSFPVRELVDLGWIEANVGEVEKANQLLEFFGVYLSKQWKYRYPQASFASAFRTSRSFGLEHEAVATWLRQGERKASEIECANWDRELFKTRLLEARALTRNRHPARFFPKLQKLCSECGVALAAVPEPSGCPASGATQFLTRSKALIILSFRFKSDDHFWFSFFHEAGHLLLHNPDAIFIDDDISQDDSEEEREANEFAQNLLIPAEHREAMLRLPAHHGEVIRAALTLGIAPGIVVGQMQKAGVIPYNYLNKLKRRYNQSDIAAVF